MNSYATSSRSVLPTALHTSSAGVCCPPNTRHNNPLPSEVVSRRHHRLSRHISQIISRSAEGSPTAPLLRRIGVYGWCRPFVRRQSVHIGRSTW